MIVRVLGTVFGLVGAVSTAGLGYLEFECRTNGKYCEQSLFSDTPETLDALLEEQRRLSEKQDEIGSKLDKIGAPEGSSLPTRSGNQGDILERLDALEKKIDEVDKKVTKTGTYGPIKLDYAYTAEFETVIYGTFEISLRGCQRNATNVQCAFIIKNTAAETDLVFYSGERTIAYMPDGESLRPARVTLDKETGSRWVRKNFPTEIPAQALLDFTKVPEDIPGFPLLKIAVDPGNMSSGYIEFENVRFQ